MLTVAQFLAFARQARAASPTVEQLARNIEALSKAVKAAGYSFKAKP